LIDRAYLDKRYARLQARQKSLDLDWKDWNASEILYYQEQDFKCEYCVVPPKLKDMIVVSVYRYSNLVYEEGYNFSEYHLACPKCGLRHRMLPKHYLELINRKRNIFLQSIDERIDSLYSTPYYYIEKLGGKPASLPTQIGSRAIQWTRSEICTRLGILSRDGLIQSVNCKD
jgi:hypothetical protein